MATLFHRGFFDDLAAGLVVTGVDLRPMLVMTNTTSDTEGTAQKVADFTTLDECDGVGYVRPNPGGATVAWDGPNSRLELDVADGAFTSAGTLDNASRDLAGILWFRHVDGTAANDVPWFFSDDGGFPKTPSGGDATYVVNGETLIHFFQAP